MSSDLKNEELQEHGFLRDRCPFLPLQDCLRLSIETLGRSFSGPGLPCLGNPRPPGLCLELSYGRFLTLGVHHNPRLPSLSAARLARCISCLVAIRLN